MIPDYFILLYIIHFIPTSGTHKTMLDTTREAFLRQSGASAKYHQVKAAAERKVPKQLTHAAVIYKVVEKQEMRVRHGKHVFVIRKNGIEAAIKWEW